MPRATAAKSDAVAAILATAAKKYNGLKVGGMNDVSEDTVFISSGNMAIDYAIGGGIPQGRSIECYGPPSCGKSTTAIQHAAVVQKIIKAGGDLALNIGPDDYILYLDYEYTLDKKYCAALGLDIEHPSFLYSAPDTLEDGANISLELLKTGKVRLVLIDSVAAMNPSAQAEADDIGKPSVAVAARLLKTYGVTLNSVLANNHATAIFLNHEKEVIGGFTRPGAPPRKVTPGGLSIKYFASIRMQYTQQKQHKGKVVNPVTKEVDEIPVMTDVKVRVDKNKVAPPFRQALVRVRYGKGFDNFWNAMQVLIGNKKITYQTGRYYFHRLEEQGLAPEWMPREKTGTQRPFIFGEATLYKIADKQVEWRNAMIAYAMELIKENEALLEAEDDTPTEEEVDLATGEVLDEELADLVPLEEDSPTGKRVSF